MLALLLFGSVVLVYTQTRPIPKTLSAREIASKVIPSTVLILTFDENDRPVGQGSGFFFRPGHVVTNLHVLDRATSAQVKDVKTGRTSKALAVVGIDAINDLCVIRVDNESTPPIPFGNSDVATGDEIYVASNPKGLEGSITKGIVSNVRNQIGLIQIDAAISPGSSGGVLINTQAQAIGIIKSSIVSGQNLNFAIPIDKLAALPFEFQHKIILAGSLAYSALKADRLKGPVWKVVYKERPLDTKSGQRTSSVPIVIYEGEFNRAGQSVLQSYYDLEMGRFIYKVAKFYQSNGLLYRQIKTSSDGKSDDFTLTKDEAIDFAVSSRRFSGSFNESNRKNTYDSQGNEVSSVGEGDNVESLFNSEGLEIQATFYKGSTIEKIRRYSYKYDSYGNWIEKTVSIIFPNRPPFNQKFLTWTGETEYRDITYFK